MAEACLFENPATSEQVIGDCDSEIPGWNNLGTDTGEYLPRTETPVPEAWSDPGNGEAVGPAQYIGDGEESSTIPGQIADWLASNWHALVGYAMGALAILVVMVLLAALLERLLRRGCEHCSCCQATTTDGMGRHACKECHEGKRPFSGSHHPEDGAEGFRVAANAA